MSIDPIDINSGKNGTPPRTLVDPAAEESPLTPYKSRCPHFALGNDPTTTILFPSPAGYCYRAAPPSAIKLDHQQDFCLSPHHQKCPVFLQDEPGPLPRTIRRPRQKTRADQRPFAKKIFTGLIISAGIIAAVWFGSQVLYQTGSANQGQPAIPTRALVAIIPSATETKPAAVLPAETSTPETSPTATAVPATQPPTPSPAPTATATPVPTSTPTPPPPLPPVARVIEPFVNVRYGPSTDYGLITNLREAGAQFEVTGRSESGDWWQVCCINDQPGWITADTVDITEETTAVPVLPHPLSHAVVQVIRLNIRQSPDLDGEVMKVIVKEDRFDVIGRLFDDSWWQVCCVDGETGWVYGESVTIEGILSEIPIVNRP